MKADIVERLRAWVYTVKAVPASDLMDEAADEIERLRADWPDQLKEARSEIERLRLSAKSDFPVPENAVSEDISVRKTGGDFGQPSPASAGSQAVAWVVALGGDGLIIDGIFLRRTQAEEACAWRNEHTTYGARIIPLYEKPQTTLTDEERDVLAAIEADASYRAMKRTERVVRELLDRTK